MGNNIPTPSVQHQDGVAYRVYRCARLLRTHFHALGGSRGLDLSQEQWFILNRLAAQDGLAQGQLGDTVLDDRPNIARMVASLEARDLVRRSPDPVDGRKRRVFLTPLGRRVHDDFAALVPGARLTILKGVSEQDLVALVRVLSAIESNLSLN